MHPTTLTIGGEDVRGVEPFSVIDPALGEPFAESPAADASQLDAAQRVFPACVALGGSNPSSRCRPSPNSCSSGVVSDVGHQSS